MKTKLIHTLTAFLVTLSVSAQQQPYKGEITVVPNILEQRGDSIYVKFDLNIKGVKVYSHRSVDFIPVLVSSKGRANLPMVSLKGRNNHKDYKRDVSLMSRRQKAAHAAPYLVSKGYRYINRQLHYHYQLPYQAWMGDAQLDLQQVDNGCGSVLKSTTQTLVSDVTFEKVVEPYQIIPHIAYLQPEVEVVKRRALQNESYLDFAVNRTEIRPDFGNNPAELTKIREMIEDIKNDAAITIKHITITGYASPEGSLANNQRLSEGRAKALEGYLQSRYNLSKDLYTINFGGEDWDGLVELVEASDILYKQEVLDIILNTSIENNREKKLMNLKGGVPYRHMLHDMFPKLRRVICKIDYNVKTFDVNEAKELVKTKPQNLSLNEMYQVAVTYEKGSDEFNNVFYVAVKMFPNDQTANLNAAATALSRGDIVSAEEYLNNVNSRVRIAQYDNLIGVILMIKGNYDRAEQYFKSAEQTGLYEATKNLEEIAKKHANELEYRNSKHK